MESLDIISQWLKKQHVLTFCTGQAESLWCANAFYIFDNKDVTFYLLSETTTRHGQLIGQRAATAGTVNGQPKSIALIRGVQFQGEISLLDRQLATAPYEAYCRRFPIARVHAAPLWAIRLNELKMTDNTLGFGKKIHWLREGTVGG